MKVPKSIVFTYVLVKVSTVVWVLAVGKAAKYLRLAVVASIA